MISKENPLAVELKYFVRPSNIYAKVIVDCFELRLSRFDSNNFVPGTWPTQGWRVKFHFIAHAGTIKEATYRDKALVTVLNVAAAIFQRKKMVFYDT